MEGRWFSTVLVALLGIVACRIDSVGLAPDGSDATGAGGDGASSNPSSSATTPSTGATQASSSAGGAPPGTGGAGGTGSTGATGGGGTGTAGGGGEGGVNEGGGGGGGGGAGGAPPVDECAEGTDDCLAGERCTDLPGGFDCTPLKILILEESDGSRVVGVGLTALGADVFEGPGFASWDATNPPLDGFDALVWFQAVGHLTQMGAEAQTVLAAFVAAGGGLVRTEWAAYVSPMFVGPADSLLPVTFLGSNAMGATWNRVVSDHPIGATLPPSFFDGTMFFSLVSASPGATVVWENSAAIPMVVTTEAFGGPVVYVNHAVTNPTPVIGPEATQIFIDAALFAAR